MKVRPKQRPGWSLKRDGSAVDPAAPATPPATEARFPRLKKLLGRIKQAGQAAGQVAMDWLSIPRQLKYLAWVLIGLSIAFLLFKALRRSYARPNVQGNHDE